jgi:hypothetical protein
LNVTVTQCSAPAPSFIVNNNNQITSWTYDAAGNVLNDTTNSYAWDAENRLISASGVTYTYDGDDWRVEKSNGELHWYAVGCGHDDLMETDLAGNVSAEYIYLAGERIARRDARPGDLVGLQSRPYVVFYCRPLAGS